MFPSGGRLNKEAAAFQIRRTDIGILREAANENFVNSCSSGHCYLDDGCC
jgi:hypothetical protein